MTSDVLPGVPPTRPRTLVIPYGIEALPSARIVDCEAVPYPCEVIDTGSANTLKLNNCRYRLEATAASLAGTEPFQAIRQHLIDLCGTWSQLPRRFLEYYFGEVEAIVEGARVELSHRLSPCEGLFTYKDWRFSAPKPLPRAFVQVEDPTAPASFVQVEFAFWLGDRMLAVQSEPGPMTPRAASQQTERLARTGIECFSYGAADIVPGRRELMMRMLGANAMRFWSGEILPTGPFRPEVPMPS